MADYLASYESEFSYVFNEIKEKSLSVKNENGLNDTIIASMEDLFDEAYGVLERMSAEVQGLPTAQRSQFNTKIRGYRGDVDKIKREFRKSRDSLDRQQLFGDRGAIGNRDQYTDESDSQRQQLLTSQQRLEQSTERLLDAQRVGNETEAIGAGILSDLRGQREQIINSRNTLTEADSYIDKSLRTLRSMARRMAANKLISYAIIAVLILMIIFVLASKLM